MAGVVLDASVLIALYSSSDSNHDWAMGFFRQTLDRELKMSVLNYSECIVHPTKAGKLQQFISGVTGLGIEVVGLDPDCGQDLGKLRVETGLRMPDVLVIHEALISGAAVASTDAVLARAAQLLSLEVFSPRL